MTQLELDSIMNNFTEASELTEKVMEKRKLDLPYIMKRLSELLKPETYDYMNNSLNIEPGGFSYKNKTHENDLYLGIMNNFESIEELLSGKGYRAYKGHINDNVGNIIGSQIVVRIK